jgi:hypothetical protein
MFRTLSQKFNKRKSVILGDGSKFNAVADNVLNLLNKEFGTDNLNLKLEYSSKDKILSIIAPSKTIANELSMRSHEIMKSLALKELAISRIRVI